MSSISYRDSIRWLADDTSEPTDTIVLTGHKSNIFLDVRFLKGTSELDWAFAGYRSTQEPNQTRFTHLIDSRTTDAMSVEDCGTNTQLPDGRTLECGEMVNPATGNMTAHEEIWRDETHNEYLFVKNYEGSKWLARVGDRHLGLGRDEQGFWAWQAQRENGAWNIKHCTNGGEKHVWMLPEDHMQLDKDWIVVESSQE